MNPFLVFWAKLGSAIWPEKYHPVICHLIDVGQVARRLWSDVCRSKVREWVTDRLGLPDQDAAGAWLAFWAGAHDIGKVSPDFQGQGKTAALRALLMDAGFNFNHSGGTKPHGDVSTAVLAAELTRGEKWPKVDAAVARAAAIAVGGHHGMFPTDWDSMHGPLGNEPWASARRVHLAELARRFGVIDLAAPRPPDPGDQSVWMYVAGLTSVADWIGSNKAFFNEFGNKETLTEPFNPDDYFRDAGAKAGEALETLGWQGRSNDQGAVSIGDYLPEGRDPRPLQTAVVALAERMTGPGLLIVEAPMGEGKTEAGWYAAACWDRRGGQGAYVALPTMATSNQMFDRVGKFLEVNAGKNNLMLQHGKAALNEHFEKLNYAAQVYDDEEQPSAVVAEGWFAANKKHGLLAPYGVGTIDQALLAVLQTMHVFVRLFGLAGKCVILDEVHAYDAYMTTLMERLLRWLAALGCPVVLLSATLPRDKRLKLLRAYAGDGLLEPEDKPYPRVTRVAVGSHQAEVTPVESDPTRARTVQLGWLDESALAEKLRQALADGGCAVVIRNTVGLAQATYLRLRDELTADGIAVELFHARFPFGRRMEIEDAVLTRFGKDGGPAERNKRLLVATQVVEQSLDLDFDLMVSDVAPVDLVLQRAGRLHRHKRERPAGVAVPRLWLIEPEVKEGLPDFGPSERVYARFVLLRSSLALRAVEAVRLPGDLEYLVEQVYGTKPLKIPAGWQAALDDSAKELNEKQDNQQLNATEAAINEPDQSPLEQQSQQLEEDDPEASRKIQALTRDSDPTVRLIVVYHLGGRDYLDPAGLEPFDETDMPDPGRIRRLLANEVTLSHPGCVACYARRPGPSRWRKRGMLRFHRIVRVDGQGTALPGEFPLWVDREQGIRFKEIKCVAGGV